MSTLGRYFRKKILLGTFTNVVEPYTVNNDFNFFFLFVSAFVKAEKLKISLTDLNSKSDASSANIFHKTVLLNPHSLYFFYLGTFYVIKIQKCQSHRSHPLS